ncbi:transcription antitermination factor NusB [soil metagenome]
MTDSEPRDLVLTALYEADRTGQQPDVASLPPKAKRLIAGVVENTADLDRAIDAASEHWRVDRMPVVDLAILRLGLYELKFQPDVPVAVIVNEAVRLAKTYSTKRSGAFVNGVLSALAATERPT